MRREEYCPTSCQYSGPKRGQKRQTTTAWQDNNKKGDSVCSEILETHPEK